MERASSVPRSGGICTGLSYVRASTFFRGTHTRTSFRFPGRKKMRALASPTRSLRRPSAAVRHLLEIEEEAHTSARLSFPCCFVSFSRECIVSFQVVVHGVLSSCRAEASRTPGLSGPKYDRGAMCTFTNICFPELS